MSRKMAKVSRAQNVFKPIFEQIYYISKTLTSTEISIASITSKRTNNTNGFDHNLSSFYFVLADICVSRRSCLIFS